MERFAQKTLLELHFLARYFIQGNGDVFIRSISTTCCFILLQLRGLLAKSEPRLPCQCQILALSQPAGQPVEFSASQS